MKISRRRIRFPAAVLAAMVVFLLVATSGTGDRTSSRSAAVTSLSVQPAAAPQAALAAHSTPSAAPSSWAGTTVETLLPNYNASLSRNFRSLVEDWKVGTPTVVPSTGTVWFPTLPASVGGSPAPPSAPALLYNISNNSFSGIDRSVVNTSAFALDPTTGLLYATNELSDTVEAINVSTEQPTGVSYPVGDLPTAITYDSRTGDLFVANSGSNSVTVINPLETGNQAIVWSDLAAGKTPIALADDTSDHWMYIADAGTANVSRLNTINLSAPLFQIPIYDGNPAGIAYSPETGFLAVTSPASTDLTIISGEKAAVVPTSIHVGGGCAAVTVVDEGSKFLVANVTGSSLSVVNATKPFGVSVHKISVGLHPSQFAVLPQTGATLVWNNASRTISSVSSTLSSAVTRPFTLGPSPDLIAYDAGDSHLFVADPSLPGLEVLDPFTGRSVLPAITLPSPPLALALDAATSTLYVGMVGEIQACNTSTGGLLPPRSWGGPSEPLALDLQTNVLWVGNASAGQVVGLSASSLKQASPGLLARITPATGDSLLVDPATGSLFVINSTTDYIEQFNGTTGALVGSPLNAGTNVSALVYDPADGLVYAAGDALQAIDPATMTLSGSPIPLAPHTSVGGILYEPSRGAIYVGTWRSTPYSGSLSVVNGSSPAAALGSLTYIPTGFEPVSLAGLDPTEGGLPGSGVVFSANQESGTVSVIASSPEIVSAAFTPDHVDANVSTELAVSAVGGAGASTVSYSGLPTGCRSEDALVIDCVPTAAGDYAVLVTVTDSLGETVTATADLSVATALGLTVSLGVDDSHEADVDVPIEMIATAANGTQPYSFAWSLGNGAVGSGPSVDPTYAAPGEYVVGVTATDAGGGVAVDEIVLTVSPVPSVTLSVSPSDAVTDVGLPVTLTATVTGGSAPGSGSWSFGDGSHLTGSPVQHSWSAKGEYAVTYTYTDAVGIEVGSSVNVLVDPVFHGTFAVSWPSPNPEVGTEFSFNASLWGGDPPYTVEWWFGDGSTQSGANFTHAYGAPGTYTVDVSAVDLAGAGYSRTFTLTVASASSTPAPLFGGGFGSSFIVGLVLGGCVAAVVLFIAERRRRAGPGGPPSPYVPPTPVDPRGRP